MKYLLYLLIYLFCVLHFSNSFCQKSHSIEIFATPSIVQIGDPNKRYVEITDDHIQVNYFNSPSQEIGFTYLQNRRPKLGWGIGLSWKRDLHKIDIGIQRDPNDWSTTTDHFFYTMEIGNINLRLIFTYKLNERIRFDAILNACSPYPIYTNVPQYFQIGRGSTQLIITPDSTYTNHLYGYDLDIKSKGIGTRKIIPEFRITTEIYKNIKLNFGTRIKFWEGQSSYFKLNVDGYFGAENKGNSQILHKSEISSKEFSFYFGLTYDIPLRKRSTQP